MTNKIFSFFSKNEQTPESLEQLTALLELIPTALCLIDEKGDILFANSRTAAVSGVEAHNLKGSNISKYGLPLADIAHLLDNQGPANIIKEMVTKDIESVYMSVSAARVPNTNYVLLSFDDAPQYRQLMKEKTFFQSVVAHYPFPVTVQDKKDICLIWNEKAAKMFGVEAAQAIGRKMKDLVPQQLASALEMLDKEVKQKKQNRMGKQMSFKNARGNEITLSVTKVPTFDDQGEISTVLTVFEDITSRRHQEEDLLQTRNLLQAILDHVPLGIYTRTVDGVMTFFNKQSQTVFAEAEPKYANTPHPNQDPNIVRRYNEREREILEEGTARDYPDEIYTTHDGSEKIIHMIKVPLKHAGPEPLVLTIVEDVTKRREQEKEIVTANSFLSAIVENAPIGLYARTKTGKMLLRNKMCESIFGSEEHKFDEQGSLPHETKEQVASYLNREAEVLESGQPLNIAEEPYKTEAGNMRLLHMVKVPVSDAEGNPEFVITMVEDVTEKKEQERKLIEAKNFQQAILDNAPLAIYARGVNQVMSFVNKKAQEVFPEENIYKEENNFYGRREQEMFHNGKIMDIPEEEYTTKTGKKIVLHLIKVPVYDKEGKPFMMLSIAEDITAKREQARKLTETQNIQQAVLDNAPMAIYAYGADHRLCFCNREAERLFPDAEVVDAADEAYNLREEEIFKNRKIVDIPEEEYVRPDGQKRLFHLTKAPVFDSEGKPFMVLTIAEDITQKKQQEIEIREAKNFLQNVVDNLPIALSVKRYDGEYIVWNKKSENLFGVAAQDVIGKNNYRTDITKEQAEFLRESDNKVFESHKELNIPQELISTPTEGVKIMHTVKTPLYKADGTPDYLLNVSEDITAKTKMEKQIREAGEKNSLLVENSKEGIIILEDEKIIYANHAACKVLGYETAEEIVRKSLFEFIPADYQIFAKEKYESVANELEGSQNPVQMPLTKKSGARAEVEFAAMASKYLGRRIVIVFLRDVTVMNKTLREVRGEREKFKNVFEKGLLPAFILNHKGYINTMNKAARDMFHLTDADRNFYRNVYIRPALTLDVRRKLRRGESARMDYEFDFAKAEAKFPGRIHGEGKIPLHVALEPFNRRDAKDGTVEADYLVTLDRRDRNSKGSVPPPPVPPVVLHKKEHSVAPQPPAALLLPDTEPYVVCSSKFKITSCNDLFCNLCQLNREELKGQELSKIFSADSVPLLKEDLKILSSKGSLENREYNICLASGLETSPVRVSAQFAKNGSYIFIFRNMAFQKQIMSILQERSAQLNALLEATDGAVFTVEYEDGQFGRVLQANKFLTQLIGYSHDELTNMPFEHLFVSPDGKNKEEMQKVFAQAAKTLEEKGRASFGVPLFAKDGRRIETSVTVTSLDIPGKNCVLALVTDLSDLLARLAQNSPEALELRSMRQSLPGIYLKTDLEGRVLEVSSNLPYLTAEEATSSFLGKMPLQYWPEDAAAKEVFAIKEASSVHINTTFEFDWECAGKRRYFEALCTPLDKQDEVIIWVRDVTQRHTHEKHIRELYAISNENKCTITEQVDKILDFGKKVFKSDVGIVMRFRESNPDEMTVVYATPSPFNIERYMVFPVEECLFDVRDDNVVVFPDLANTNCKRCIHKEKHFGSLIAAPLYVGGKVAGVLCFAASAPKARFEEGAEELIGIMSRILSLRIELREASKTLGETSQSFIRTLEYVDLPAVVLDLQFRVKYANNVFLAATGRRRQTVENREFFDEFIRSANNSRDMFVASEKNASGNAFQVNLDLVDEHGKYFAAGWDVFLIKDIKGDVEGYGLIGIRKK